MGRNSYNSRNPDFRFRRVERDYQTEPTLDNLIKANIERHRIGQSLYPFFEETLDFLKDQRHYLGQPLPLPQNSRARHARIRSGGRRSTAANSEFFVDRTVIEIAPFLVSRYKNDFPRDNTYRLVITYNSQDNILSLILRSSFLFGRIPPKHALSRGYPGLNNLTVQFLVLSSGLMKINYIANQESHLQTFPEDTYHSQEMQIIDTRELPNLLFSHLKRAFDIYHQQLAQDLRDATSQHDISRELFTYLRFIAKTRAKIAEEPLIDFALGKADFNSILQTIIKNEVVDRLRVPESGIPERFNKFEVAIVPSWSRKITNRAKDYYLSLDLYYDDTIQESDLNDALAKRYSDDTVCDFYNTPTITANLIKAELQNNNHFSECNQQWRCEPEVLDYDGIGIEVVVRCQIKLDICLFNWLMTEFD